LRRERSPVLQRRDADLGVQRVLAEEQAAAQLKERVLAFLQRV
jgi:hypothetical protein